MRSGQVTVTTAGTAVQMTSVRGQLFAVSALPTNTGTMYVGSDSTNVEVAATTGYPLIASQSIAFACDNLSEFWVDASVSGEKVAWVRLA